MFLTIVPMVLYAVYEKYHMLLIEDCHFLLFEVSFALMTPLASMTAMAALLMCLKWSGPERDRVVPLYHLEIATLLTVLVRKLIFGIAVNHQRHW